MKLNKILATALMMCASLTGMAQFTGGGTAQSVNSTENENSNFSHLSLGYHSVDIEEASLNGVNAEYTYNINVVKTIPLYVEVGGGLAYTAGDDFKLLNLNVPVNLGYKFNIADSFSIMPYTGVSMKYNILFELDGHDLFDIDGVKRFQIGWNIGARLGFKNFTIGFRYTKDMTDIVKECDSSALTASIGFTF